MIHVLLLEPDRVLAKTYSEFLQTQGMGVMSASGAQTAIEAADALTPDVIVLELQLASHNGIEFLHELRSHADWQDIPVIIHSLLPLHELETYASAWRQFGVGALCSKTATSLDQLAAVITKAAL